MASKTKGAATRSPKQRPPRRRAEPSWPLTPETLTAAAQHLLEEATFVGTSRSDPARYDPSVLDPLYGTTACLTFVVNALLAHRERKCQFAKSVRVAAFAPELTTWLKERLTPPCDLSPMPDELRAYAEAFKIDIAPAVAASFIEAVRTRLETESNLKNKGRKERPFAEFVVDLLRKFKISDRGDSGLRNIRKALSGSPTAGALKSAEMAFLAEFNMPARADDVFELAARIVSGGEKSALYAELMDTWRRMHSVGRAAATDRDGAGDGLEAPLSPAPASRTPG